MPRALLGLPLVLAAFGLSSVAHADGAVVGATAVTDVRIAVATANGRTVRWASVHATGGNGAFAWLVPIRPDSMVDYASDAWLEGLDDSTAPRVTPPIAPPQCGETLDVEVLGNSGHVVTTAPTSATLTTNLTQLQGVATSWGFALDDALATRLGQSFTQGESFLALLYSAPSSDVVTRTLRIIDDGPAIIPLVLTRSEAAPIQVTAYVLGQGLATFQGAGQISLNPAAVTWNADGTSTYGSARDAALAVAPGSWLIEGANHGALFDGVSLTSPDVVTVPSLAASYFQRAATYGETESNPSECVLDAQSDGMSAAPLDPPCPAGAVAQVGTSGQTCTPPQTPHLTCGDSVTELAQALGGVAPVLAWVTRAVTLIPAGSFGADVPLAVGSGSEDTPVIVAAGYTKSCAAQGNVPNPTPPSGGTGIVTGGPGSGGGAGQGAVVGSSDNSPDVPDVPTDGCDSSGGSDDDSGGGCDSSSGSGDSGGGCGGGSSGDSGGGCSGGDGGGGGCDGGGGSGDCGVTRRPHGKSPLSRYMLGFAIGAALLRRLTRRKSA